MSTTFWDGGTLQGNLHLELPEVLGLLLPLGVLGFWRLSVFILSSLLSFSLKQSDLCIQIVMWIGVSLVSFLIFPQMRESVIY